MTRTVDQRKLSQGSKSSASQISMRSFPQRKLSLGSCCEKRLWAARNNSGRFSLRRATTGKPKSLAVCRKGAVEASIHNHVIGKAHAQFRDDSPQQSLPGGIFTIARPIGFHVDGQRQSRAHHAHHHQVMAIAHNLFLRIAERTAQGTLRLATAAN